MTAEEVSAPKIMQRDGAIQKALAIIVTLGLFIVIGFMLLYSIPETGHDALLLLIGALSGGWATVLNYYFGSSSGSAIKTALRGVTHDVRPAD